MKRTRKALAPILCAGMALGGIGIAPEQAGAGEDNVSLRVSYTGGYETGYGQGYSTYDSNLAGTLWVGGRSHRISECDDVLSSIARTMNRLGYRAEVCNGQVRVTTRNGWHRLPGISWSSGLYRASIYGGRDCLTISIRRVVRTQCGPTYEYNNGYQSRRSHRYNRGRTYRRTTRSFRPRRYGRDYYRDGYYNRCD